MITEYCLKNDFVSASKLQIEYLDLINKLFIDVNPIPVKEALNILGMNAGECRMPLCSMTDTNVETLRNSMKAHGLI